MSIENPTQHTRRFEQVRNNSEKTTNPVNRQRIIYAMVVATLLTACKNRFQDDNSPPDYSNFPDAGIPEKPDTKAIPLHKLPPHDIDLTTEDILKIISNDALKKLLIKHGHKPFNVNRIPTLPDFSCTDPKQTPRLSFTTKDDRQISVPIVIINKNLKKRLRQRWKRLHCR